MVFSVEQRHIDRGTVKDVSSCPVALCLQETDKYAWAGPFDVCYNLKFYKTPNNVLEFMNKFDSGEEVEPFEFELVSPIG